MDDIITFVRTYLPVDWKKSLTTAAFGILGLVSLSYAQRGNVVLAKEQTDIHSEAVAGKMAVQNLILEIRAATKQFKDAKEAERAGYRPFGPDMPNMGRHWVNTRMALDREIDLGKPSTLTYLNIGSELILTGVAYTTAVQPGEEPPPLPHAEMHWHYHSGRLEDEAHGIHRESEVKGPLEGARLAMVHAWVWSENPAGTFAADNWSLSFLRHGLQSPHKVEKKASEALFLASGQADYLLRFIELCITSGTYDKEEVGRVVSKYSAQISAYISNIPESGKVSLKQQQDLKQSWESMWEEIRKILGDKKWTMVSKHLDHH